MVVEKRENTLLIGQSPFHPQQVSRGEPGARKSHLEKIFGEGQIEERNVDDPEIKDTLLIFMFLSGA